LNLIKQSGLIENKYSEKYFGPQTPSVKLSSPMEKLSIKPPPAGEKPF
jgi:hypothetical protein